MVNEETTRNRSTGQSNRKKCTRDNDSSPYPKECKNLLKKAKVKNREDGSVLEIIDLTYNDDTGTAHEPSTEELIRTTDKDNQIEEELNVELSIPDV